MAKIKRRVGMAITRTQLVKNYGFRPSKDNKKLLTRKLGGEETIDVYGNVLFYKGQGILTLEWMPSEMFSRYLEKMINSIKKQKLYRERAV